MSDTVLEVTQVVTELVIGDGQQTVLEVGGQPVVVEVFEGGPQTVLEIGEQRVDILTIGIQGPAGRDGLFGDFIHAQSSAAMEWTVNHNLGRRPNAEIYDAGGNVVDAEILHISANQLRALFSSAQSGSVRCI